MAIMASPNRRRAVTKRVGNLIRSLKWNAGHIDQFLLAEAAQEVERLKALGKRILAIMDGSVVEKPESRSPQAIGPAIGSQSETAQSVARGIALQPASFPTHPGDGNGMDRNHHYRLARHSQAGRDAVLDHQGGLCRKVARERRRGAARAGAPVGALAHLCL